MLKVVEYEFMTTISNDSRTFSLIGTPHYMAPEMILGLGYSSEVDLWAFGVLCYELLYKELPFGDQIEDPFLVFEMILN